MMAESRCPIQCLTLHVETGSSQSDRLELRRLATMRPPQIQGLRARSWCRRPRALVGQYLFDDMVSLRRFCAQPETYDPGAAEFLVEETVSQKCNALPISVATEIFDRPVFIVSAPRAGSTLLYDLLKQCDQLWSVDGEMQHLVDALPNLNLANRGFKSQALTDIDADAATATVLRSCLIAAMQSSAGIPLLAHPQENWPTRVRFLEKTPENSLRIRFLRKIFPDARFIYLYRDLRQNVASIIQAWKHPGFVAIPDLPGWSMKNWCFLLPDRWREFDGKSLCQVAAFQWAAANQAIINELDAMASEQWTTITYADLVADPVGQIEHLCQFIGIEPGERLRETLTRPLSLSPTTITPPSPIKWKHNPDFDPAVVKPLQPLAGRMRSLRVNAVPEVGRAPDQTTVRFACFVDELAITEPMEDAVVASSLHAQAGGSVPLGLVRKLRHRERFLTDYPMLWVEDSATRVWTPLWLRRKQAWLCASLKPGQPPPPALTGSLRHQLFTAGVLSRPELIAARGRHGIDLCRTAERQLSRLGYCQLPRLVDPVLCKALSQYFNCLIDAGEWPIGDAQVERRHGWHNERIAQFMHYQLVEFVSRVAGRPLKPTYTFSSAYKGGARLDAHMDREQCEYTLSVLIDETPPADLAPWPLWIETPEGRRSVILNISDGILFRGCELPHWRGAASSEHAQINLLFHFVRADWPGVMD